MSTEDPIPYGFCHCGCGERTSINPRNHRTLGLVKGEPRLWLVGHDKRFRGADYVEDENGCWIWQRSLDIGGYGRLVIDGKSCPAHRYIWEREHGPVPAGLEMDHLCRVRACVNPDHLEPVTRAENIRRGLKTKLTREDVRAIRAEQQSGRTMVDLAAAFGVDPTTIYDIWKGRSWREPDNEEKSE